MKKFVILLFILMLTGYMATAQTAIEHKEKTKAKGDMVDKEIRPAGVQDGIMMQGGRMMVMRAGKPTVLNEDMKLANGTTVMRDGTVKMADGSTKKMHNGDRVDMQGNMSHDHAGHSDMDQNQVQQDGAGKGKLKVKDDKIKAKGAQGETKVKKDDGELKLKHDKD